jgi:hypothetical protein
MINPQPIFEARASCSSDSLTYKIALGHAYYRIFSQRYQTYATAPSGLT